MEAKKKIEIVIETTDGRKVKDGDFFAVAPFGLYDIVKVISWKEQYKTACIGGKWQKTNVKEQILSEWEVY